MDFPFGARNASEVLPPLVTSHPIYAFPYAILLGIFALVGTLGNILVIGTNLTLKEKDQMVGDIFIVNLAASDMIVTALINPVAILGTVTPPSRDPPPLRTISFLQPHLCTVITIICLVLLVLLIVLFFLLFLLVLLLFLFSFFLFILFYLFYLFSFLFLFSLFLFLFFLFSFLFFLFSFLFFFFLFFSCSWSCSFCSYFSCSSCSCLFSSFS